MELGGAITGLVGRTASGNDWVLDKVAEGIQSLAKAGETALGSVNRLTAAMVDLFRAPLASATALAAVIGPLVAAFNPGLLQQFALALHDTNAVLGAMFTPILRALTTYVRQFGDVLAGMIPVFAPLTAQIGQFIIDFGTGFTSMLRAAAPLIEKVSDALTWFIRQLSYGVGFLTGAVTELLNIITSLLGLTSRFDDKAQSAGFGTRNVKTGTVQQFAEDVFASNARNAYARDTGVKDPQQASEELRKAMEAGKQAMVELKDAISGAVDWLDRNLELPTVPTAAEIGQAIADGIRNGLANWRPWR